MSSYIQYSFLTSYETYIVCLYTYPLISTWSFTPCNNLSIRSDQNHLRLCGSSEKHLTKF